MMAYRDRDDDDGGDDGTRDDYGDSVYRLFRWDEEISSSAIHADGDGGDDDGDLRRH